MSSSTSRSPGIRARRWMARLLATTLLALGAISDIGTAQAALTINSVDTPTRIGRGQTVPVPLTYTRASGSSAETITVDAPAVLEVVAALPAGCSLCGTPGTPGTPQTLTCTGSTPAAGATITVSDQLPPNFEWVTGTTFTPSAVPGAFAGLTSAAWSARRRLLQPPCWASSRP